MVVKTCTTVYVVDDDEIVRDALVTLLRSAGYCVAGFESAVMFLKSADHTEKGVLVLDVRMPEMGGLELQQQLVDSGTTKPIIFITAHDDSQIQKKALKAGAVAFLKKPFEDQQLFDAIELCIDRYR